MNSCLNSPSANPASPKPSHATRLPDALALHAKHLEELETAARALEDRLQKVLEITPATDCPKTNCGELGISQICQQVDRSTSQVRAVIARLQGIMDRLHF